MTRHPSQTLTAPASASRLGVLALLLAALLQSGAAAQATTAPTPAKTGGVARYGDDTYLFDLQDCTYDDVLNEFSRLSRLKIDRKVATDGRVVEVKSHSRLTLDQAIELINVVLSEQDIAAIRKADTLEIVSRDSLRLAAVSMERAFILERIALEDDLYVAYINNVYEGKSLRVKVGDKVAKGRIAGIVGDRVDYAREGALTPVYVGCDLTGAEVQLHAKDSNK